MHTETRLSEHGIQNELSDVRVHVCSGVRRIYVFPTRSGKEAAERCLSEVYSAFQPGVEGATAICVRVPPFDIRGMVEISINDLVWDQMDLKSDEDTSVKGAKAQNLVLEMLHRGMIPLPVASASEITDLELQHSGSDITVGCGNRTVRIQVKCDIPGGSKHLGGRGLCLQLAERNPLRKF